MTKLLNPPTAVDVTLDHGRAPIAIAGAFNGSVEPIARWKVEGLWWDRPVVREYWKAVLNNELLFELYRDATTNEWFVERVYD
jgi:hypothetical protein